MIEIMRDIGFDVIGLLVCVLALVLYALFGKCPRCGQRFSVRGCRPKKIP